MIFQNSKGLTRIDVNFFLGHNFILSSLKELKTVLEKQNSAKTSNFIQLELISSFSGDTLALNNRKFQSIYLRFCLKKKEHAYLEIKYKFNLAYILSSFFRNQQYFEAERYLLKQIVRDCFKFPKTSITKPVKLWAKSQKSGSLFVPFHRGFALENVSFSTGVLVIFFYILICQAPNPNSNSYYFENCFGRKLTLDFNTFLKYLNLKATSYNRARLLQWIKELFLVIVVKISNSNEKNTISKARLVIQLDVHSSKNTPVTAELVLNVSILQTLFQSGGFCSFIHIDFMPNIYNQFGFTKTTNRIMLAILNNLHLSHLSIQIPSKKKILYERNRALITAILVICVKDNLIKDFKIKQGSRCVDIFLIN